MYLCGNNNNNIYTLYMLVHVQTYICWTHTCTYLWAKQLWHVFSWKRLFRSHLRLRVQILFANSKHNTDLTRDGILFWLPCCRNCRKRWTCTFSFISTTHIQEPRQHRTFRRFLSCMHYQSSSHWCPCSYKTLSTYIRNKHIYHHICIDNKSYVN